MIEPRNTRARQARATVARFCRKRALLILFAVSSSSPCSAGGRIEVVGAKSVDLGKYRAWTKRAAHYTVRNAGRGTLRIRSVKAACACARTTASREQLQTGEQATIEVAIIPNSIFGPFRKAVYVESSDPGNRFLNLFVAGNAVPLLTVTPSRHLQAGHIETNTAWSQSFRLTGNVAGLSLGDPKVESSHAVKVSLARIPNSDHAYRLDLALAPSRASGDFRCLVRVPVIAPEGHPDVDVVVQAGIGTSLQAFPSVLTLESSGKPVVRVIRLRLPKSAAIDLTPDKLKLPEVEGVELAVTLERGMRGLVVRASFSDEFVRRLQTTEELTLEFELPGAASAEVRVSRAVPATEEIKERD